MLSPLSHWGIAEFFDDLLLENEDFSLLEFLGIDHAGGFLYHQPPAQVEEVLELLAEAVRDGCGFLLKSFSPTASGCPGDNLFFCSSRHLPVENQPWFRILASS